MTNKQRTLYTKQAPNPIGPYAQGIQAGPWLFISGQIGINPKLGTVENTSLVQEAAQALDNLQAVVASGGASLQQVVKTTLYLTDLNDFETINSVYEQFFSDHQPARVCVEVSRLPKDARVEIDAVVYLSE